MFRKMQIIITLCRAICTDGTHGITETLSKQFDQEQRDLIFIIKLYLFLLLPGVEMCVNAEM